MKIVLHSETSSFLHYGMKKAQHISISVRNPRFFFANAPLAGCEFDVVRDMKRLYTRDTAPFGMVHWKRTMCRTRLNRWNSSLPWRVLGLQHVSLGADPFWSEAMRLRSSMRGSVLLRGA